MGNRVTLTVFLAFGLALSVPVLAAYLGAGRWLGAHPFWQMQVAYIGVGIGGFLALLAVLVPVGPRFSALFSSAFLLSALLVANHGKSRFVASFAEDWIAGKLWYYGAMAVSAALFLGLFLGFTRLSPGIRKVFENQTAKMAPFGLPRIARPRYLYLTNSWNKGWGNAPSCRHRIGNGFTACKWR